MIVFFTVDAACLSGPQSRSPSRSDFRPPSACTAKKALSLLGSSSCLNNRQRNSLISFRLFACKLSTRSRHTTWAARFPSARLEIRGCWWRRAQSANPRISFPGSLDEERLERTADLDLIQQEASLPTWQFGQLDADQQTRPPFTVDFPIAKP